MCDNISTVKRSPLSLSLKSICPTSLCSIKLPVRMRGVFRLGSGEFRRHVYRGEPLPADGSFRSTFIVGRQSVRSMCALYLARTSCGEIYDGVEP